MKKDIYHLLFVGHVKKIFLLSLILFSTFCKAQTAAPLLSYSPVISSGLSSPVDIVHAGDGSNRLFIVQQGGTIRIVSGGVLLPDIFLNITDSLSIGGERGLLSMAFHPNYSTNGYFFVYYTNKAGDITVARFRVQTANPNAADISSGVVLIKIPKPFANHNGGHLVFGPDGYLYFGTGDGGNGGDPNNYAQNGNVLLGKMIRIDVNNFTLPAPYYTIPTDNPFVTNAAVRDEVFSLGLRNPFRWSFDRLNNDCWIADVGQNLWEEVNYVPYNNTSGANYGWKCYEGKAIYDTTGCKPISSYIDPIFNYGHNATTGGFSITGGFVYRGTQYPSLYGYYICADYASANAWLIKPNGGGWQITQQAGLPGSIVAFGEAENAELYCVSLNGVLYRVITTGVLPVTLQYFNAKNAGSYNELLWEMAGGQNQSRFEIEYSSDGNRFQYAGSVVAENNSTNNTYRFQHQVTLFQQIFYRIKIVGRSGTVTYSQIIRLNNNEKTGLSIYPTIVTNGQINITTSDIVKQLNIFSTDGKMVFGKSLNNLTGSINYNLPSLNKGIYLIRLQTKDQYFTSKIVIQ
jgi:glucose/arabinose dehydrogenase